MLGAALLVVLGRDIIRSGLGLVLSFAGLAGIYALLGSTLLAVAQVLVYIGAISVLILFAIMITQSKSGPGRLVFQRQWWVGLAAAVVLVGLLLGSILLTAWPLEASGIIPQDAREVALTLFDQYLFAFEVVGVLLLAAVIGGLYLARRDPVMPATNQPALPALEEDA
jgi:NADH:ubiquinone oxidoreductase subunit 6 (subunit J)